MEAKIVEYGLGGYKEEVKDNNVKSERIVLEEHVPLDATGALLTLLIIKNTITEEEAESIYGRQREVFVEEALSWEAAKNLKIR